MSDDHDIDLVFLISQPRAGSTLLQYLLAGHAEIHTTAEPWLMLHPVYALREQGHEAEYGARIAYRALQDFLGTLQGTEVHYIEALRRMFLYLYGTACRQAKKRVFLDKTPRYFLIIRELSLIFPQAKFIFLLRNPLAVLASTLTTWIDGDWIRLSRHYQDLLEAPMLMLDGVRLLGERAIIVHYENLVRDSAAEVSRVCASLGLDFHFQMLEYGARRAIRGRYGDLTGIQKHNRPVPDSLDLWLALGRSRQTRHLAEAYLEALGPDLVFKLGYDYEALTSVLRQVPLQERGELVVSWSRIFRPKHSLWNKLYLIAAEFAQKRQALKAGRRVGQLLTGRL